jgi:hypothetical protein
VESASDIAATKMTVFSLGDLLPWLSSSIDASEPPINMFEGVRGGAVAVAGESLGVRQPDCLANGSSRSSY